MPTFLDKYNGNVIIIEKSAIRSLGPKQFFEAAWGLFFYFKARFSNFLAENDFWGKTTLLGESSGKFHSKCKISFSLYNSVEYSEYSRLFDILERWNLGP